MLVIKTSLAALVLLGAASAQSIELTVDGGSVPGVIDWEISGGTPFNQAGILLVSWNTGPTSLATVLPGDTRQLQVGTDLLGAAQMGGFGPDGRYVIGSLTVPAWPNLIGLTLYCQALSTPGVGRTIGDISLPRAIRFGAADSFRNRFTVMSAPRSFFPSIPLPDGRFLLAGGGQGALFAQIAQKASDYYDPITDSFSPGPDLSVERSLHSATQLSDGRWLLVGGVDMNNDPQLSAEIFNPVTLTFTAVAGMTTPRMTHTATLLPSGKVLITGGMTDLNAPNSALDPVYSTTDSTEIYDPVTNTWTAGPTLGTPRAGHEALLRGDGKVLLMGGISYAFLPNVQDTTDLYDPAVGAVGAITAGSQMDTPRAGFALTELGSGKWLLVGGVDDLSLIQQGTPTVKAEIYDETLNSFVATGSMTQARVFPIVFDLGGGRFLHAGGADGRLASAVALSSSEVYDSGTGLWTAGPTMTFARMAAGNLRTATGQWQLMGGETTTGVTNAVETYYR